MSQTGERERQERGGDRRERQVSQTGERQVRGETGESDR